MKTIVVIVAFFSVLPLGNAGTLKMVGGKTYPGVVAGIEEDSVTFIWEKGQTKYTDNEDLLFEAKGSELEKRIVPLADIESVDGVPISAYPSLFRYNIFYRVLNDFEAGRIQATATGNFINQIKGLAIFLGLTLLGIPMVIMLLSLLPLGGERVSFLSAIVYVLVLTALGFGAGFLSRLLAVSVSVASSPVIQVAFSVVTVALLGGIISSSTRRSFLHGLLFTAAWSGSLIAISKIVLMVVKPASYQIY